MNRVELHLHSDYSMLDGLGKISDYVKTAVELKMPALAITDHGTLAGVYEFYNECKKADIKTILGCEFYFVPDAVTARAEKDRDRFHVGILARGERGYRVLKELNDAAQANFYTKPLLDRNILEGLGRDAKYLTCLSGCAGSILSRSAMTNSATDFYAELRWWRSIFPHFYFEHQWHDIDGLDKKLTQRLSSMSERNDVPAVITNDCHYVHPDDGENHEVLLAIQTQGKLDDPERFKFDGDGYHLASAKELGHRFETNGYSRSQITRWLRHSLDIAHDSITDIPAWNSRSWHIPSYPFGKAYSTLLLNVYRRLDALKLSEKEKIIADNRLTQELNVIKKLGIADFLMIASYMVLWAKEHDIPAGPGRGSVAGCYTAFLLGITEVDSIKYSLRFERFLNPDRPKMPDIDFDFSPVGRTLVKQHSEELFGAEHVIPVGAFQTMKLAATFRKVASAHNIPWGEINRLSKLLNPLGDDDDTDDASVIPQELLQGYPEITAEVAGLLGTKSANSSHPSGVMIVDKADPIKTLLPKTWLPANASRKVGMMISSFDLHSSEKMGLMKMDYLGLRTLETIQVCLNMIRDQLDIDVDPSVWVPDEEDEDDEIYKMLAKGKTAGVFQMEGAACTRGIKEVRCSSFEDIAATTALYRLGPIMAGAPARYVRNKRAGSVVVAHESLRGILSATWGEMIYQEQMMDICHDIAGFNWIETDDVKETVRFKDAEKMTSFKVKFVAGCKTTSGVDRDSADEIWKMIAAQSSYLFNRCHAIAYSLVSYRTARLKLMYPLQYMTAYLATVPADSQVAHKRNRLNVLSECHEHGFRILPPEINNSGVSMTCSGSRTMQFGFIDIKGIGLSSAEKIVQLRDNNNGELTLQQANTLNKKTRESLAKCGALTEIGGPRVKRSQTEEYVDWIFDDPMRKVRKQVEGQVCLPIKDKDWAMIVGQLVQKQDRKTKNGKPFQIWSVRWDPALTFICNLWSECEGWFDTPLNSIVAVEGEWSDKYSNISVGRSDQLTILEKPNEQAR